MFARVTRYQMKPGSIDEAMSVLEGLKPQIMAMPGMIDFLNVIDDDGNGYVISVVDSQETSDANQPTVAGLWANFADFLTGPPSATGHNVMMHERA